MDIAPDQRRIQVKDFTNRWGLRHVDVQTPTAKIVKVKAESLSSRAAYVLATAAASLRLINASPSINELVINETC